MSILDARFARMGTPPLVTTSTTWNARIPRALPRARIVSPGGGGYGCAPCEAGLTGDGTTCVDTDECTVHQPCFMDRCINTEPGYQCLECPLGYTGTFEDAYAWDVHQRVFVYRNLERSNFTIQTCDDIDECATGNGGCDPLMTCINTAVRIHS
ncbi:TSP3-like protein [Mya arenaria]|uniref:TSP3-like protein n=1 Tax=Mya arenaria TaxID=6604 RepID=A0ABY7FLD5_MYAAR|nr:TSP3-like protein [Mya arenaria]